MAGFAADPRLGGPAARVADAAVTVIARAGFDGLSVRAVAAELSMSIGAVQHHFASRTALLTGALHRTVDLITERLMAAEDQPPETTVRDWLGRVLRQTLPLDEPRWREGAVWVALSAAAATHPELATEHRRYLDLLVHGLEQLIADERGDLTPAGQRSRAVMIAAVLDGLTLHGVAGALTGPELTGALDQALSGALARP